MEHEEPPRKLEPVGSETANVLVVYEVQLGAFVDETVDRSQRPALPKRVNERCVVTIGDQGGTGEPGIIQVGVGEV